MEEIMTTKKTEQQAKEEILSLVKEYCDTYHNVKKPFQEGDRIPYASRVYDSEEMTNLVDSALEFWAFVSALLLIPAPPPTCWHLWR